MFHRLFSIFMLFVFSGFAQAREPLRMPSAPIPVPSKGNAGYDMNYYAGPVISHVHIHLVYWGEGVDSEVQTKLDKFYRGIVNSTYMDQLAEYATNIPGKDGRMGTNQNIGRGSFGQTVTIHPFNLSKNLSQSDVEQELEKQIASGSLPSPDNDALYMIHFPSGYQIKISFGDSCLSWFADHEVYKSPTFGNVYYSVFPCGNSLNSFQKLTIAASHELGEAVTDPMSPLEGAPIIYPAAWLTGDGKEIGDVCAWQKADLKVGDTSFSVQNLWLKSLGVCYQADFTSSEK